MADFTLRRGDGEDLPALVDIINYYILHSHATFETEPCTVESKAAWFADFGGGRYQILVAEGSDGIIGCAYSSRYRARAAFDGTVETSIYLSPVHRARGVGTALYAALFQRLAAQPVHLAVAGVALPNDASVALHHKLGFEAVGTFREYAQKNGVLMSSTWFQRRVDGIA